MLRIAQASSSETFSKYGTAPNQRRTGATASNPAGNMDGELNVVPFSGGWEAVYRPLDDTVADMIAQFMYNAVANGSHIGYSQDASRVGVFDEAGKIADHDPGKITVLVNCDCATLVGAAVYYAGVKTDGLRKLCTWEMRDVLLGTGAFILLESKELCQQGKGIRRGDVLWRTGHTAVSLDTDTSYPRVTLDETGLRFGSTSGEQTGIYPAAAATLLKDNGLRTKDLAGNAWYTYSEAGSADYPLVSDMTYLVTVCQRNSTSASADAVYLVSAHKNNSHLKTITSGIGTSATINGLTLTIKRSVKYCRVTITRLS